MRFLTTGIVVLALLGGCASYGEKRQREDELANIYAQMGVEHFRQGDLERAKTRLSQAVDLKPDLAAAHYVLAEVYSRLEDDQAAAAEYAKAYKLDSKDPSLQNNYGAFLCRQKQYKEAEKLLSQAATNKNRSVAHLAYENLGNCALAQNNVDKAEENFREALNIQPKLLSSLAAMARLQYSKKDYLKARAYLQRYSESGGMTPQLLLLAVQVETELKDQIAVERYGSMLLSQYPDSGEARKYEQMQRASTP